MSPLTFPFFTNADVVTIKDETSKVLLLLLKKICETDAGPIDFHWIHELGLIFEFFFFTIKDEASKKIHETNGGQIKEQDSPQVC